MGGRGVAALRRVGLTRFSISNAPALSVISFQKLSFRGQVHDECTYSTPLAFYYIRDLPSCESLS